MKGNPENQQAIPTKPDKLQQLLLGIVRGNKTLPIPTNTNSVFIAPATLVIEITVLQLFNTGNSLPGADVQL